nr:unnamed protein product [Callosobruchus analis]
MRALSIQSADAFVLVYDVTDASTFEEMRAIRDQIHETKGTTNVPIVVVGNKADLSGDREVSHTEVEWWEYSGMFGQFFNFEYIQNF